MEGDAATGLFKDQEVSLDVRATSKILAVPLTTAFFDLVT
jgi:hypothetical protein